jgi:hypothetical protein
VLRFAFIVKRFRVFVRRFMLWICCLVWTKVGITLAGLPPVLVLNLDPPAHCICR